MKKLTKIFTLILSLCVALSVLNACVIVPVDNANVGGLPNYNNNVTINVVSSNSVQYESAVEMLENTRPSVFEVYAKQADSTSVSCGSGTVIGDNYSTDNETKEYTAITYFVLTCHHVIDSTDVYQVKDIDGNVFSAKLIGGDPDSDIAVICFTPEEDGYMPIDGKLHEYTKSGKTVKITKANVRLSTNSDGTSSNPVKVGETVYAIGNPLGTLGGTVTKGIVSSLDRDITVEGKKMTLMQTDCAINSGNSGGGLFDAQGNIIGVVNAGYSGSVEGLNFAIPSDDAINVFNQLVSTYSGSNYGYVEGRADFQVVSGTNANHADIAIYQYNNFFETIIYIYDVAAPFTDKFVKGDIVKSVKIRDEKVYSVTSASSLVSYINSFSYKIGDEITFNIVRENQQTSVTITLKQYIYKNTGVYA